MLKISVVDFTTSHHDHPYDVAERISLYCNNIDVPISITNNSLMEIRLEGNELVFPNVVYLESLVILGDTNISIVFPDLKEVGEMSSQGEIQDMGIIDEVDYFYHVGYYMYSDEGLKINHLSKNKYLFESKDYSRVIQINNPVSIVDEKKFKAFTTKYKFPNVVYIEKFFHTEGGSILKTFPDLKKVNVFWGDRITPDMGVIDEIDYYYDLRIEIKDPLILKVTDLGQNRFMFKNGKYSKIIKINDFN